MQIRPNQLSNWYEGPARSPLRRRLRGPRRHARRTHALRGGSRSGSFRVSFGQWRRTTLTKTSRAMTSCTSGKRTHGLCAGTGWAPRGCNCEPGCACGPAAPRQSSAPALLSVHLSTGPGHGGMAVWAQLGAARLVLVAAAGLRTLCTPASRWSH